MQTVSIIVSGKVQGVFYRQNTKEKATALGIQGTVENLDDGSVSIIASGTREQLQQLIQWCHQGPSKAKVAQVTVTEIPVQAFNGFRILR